MTALDARFFRRARKIQPVLQAESAECGLACLAMIAAYHGLRSDLAQLRQIASLSSRGVTVKGIMDVAARLRLGARALTVELHELEGLRLPCIIHWDMNHYVCLTRIGRKACVIVDPVGGERRITREELGKHFTGIAIELWADEGFEQLAKRSRSGGLGWKGIVGVTTGARSAIAQILVVALLLELVGCALPLTTQLVFDHAILRQSDELLVCIAGVAGVLCVMSSVLGSVRLWLISLLKNRIYLGWSRGIYAHLLKLPLRFFERRRLGDVVSRFNSINIIQQAVSVGFVEAILGGVMALVALGLMAHYSLLLAFISLMAALLYAGMKSLLFPVMAKATSGSISSAARQQGKLIETVRAAQTIKLMNAQAVSVGGFSKVAVEQGNWNMQLARLSVVSEGGASLIYGAERILILTLGALQVMHGHLSSGALIALIAFSWQLSLRTKTCFDFLLQARLLGIQGGRLADILSAEPEANEHRARLGIPDDLTLSMQGVSFRYSASEPWLLRHCTLAITPGTSVAIVGRTGIGKSTLMKLLLGLVEPQQGQIQLGGVDVRHLGKETLRDVVCAVTQESELLNGSIAENISLFDTAMELGEVERCARIACVHDEILAMPLGYATNLGAIGPGLSAGQRQRIALARAVYRRPRILVLDEATCHLDRNTESKVLKNLREEDLTIVSITHRLEIAVTFDRMLEMQCGTLKEATGLEVRSTPSPFAVQART